MPGKKVEIITFIPGKILFAKPFEKTANMFCTTNRLQETFNFFKSTV